MNFVANHDAVSPQFRSRQFDSSFGRILAIPFDTAEYGRIVSCPLVATQQSDLMPSEVHIPPLSWSADPPPILNTANSIKSAVMPAGTGHNVT